MRRALPALAATVALAATLLFFAPQFFASGNLRAIALANIGVLLIAGAMTMVITLGEIDISVGAQFGVASVLVGLMARGGLPLWALPLIAIVIGFALGAVNGALIAYLEAPSIVVTLATGLMLREALRYVTGGAWVEGLPQSFQWLGLPQQAGEAALLTASAVIFAGMGWGASHLAAGRFVYAAGSDREAARLAGIPVPAVVFCIFGLTGAVSGVAAYLNALRFSDVPANSGLNLELSAIAAVVVGGTPITGGRSSFSGTFVGVLLLGIIGPALTFAHISSSWSRAIVGAIILATVLAEALGRVGKAGRHLRAGMAADAPVGQVAG